MYDWRDMHHKILQAGGGCAKMCGWAGARQRQQLLIGLLQWKLMSCSNVKNWVNLLIWLLIGCLLLCCQSEASLRVKKNLDNDYSSKVSTPGGRHCCTEKCSAGSWNQTKSYGDKTVEVLKLEEWKIWRYDIYNYHTIYNYYGHYIYVGLDYQQESP